MSIKTEAYGVGAVITKALSRTAKYLGEKSEDATTRLREMEAKAILEDAADQTKSQTDESHDIGDLVKGLARQAQKEGIELSNTVQSEVKRVLDLLEKEISEKREKKPEDVQARTADTAEIVVDEVETSKQTHF